MRHIVAYLYRLSAGQHAVMMNAVDWSGEVDVA